MAKFIDRHDKNVEGRYYVDDSCIYCDFCREMAPAVFAEDKEAGIAYIIKQPETSEERELVKEALWACPIESIGDLENPGIEVSCSGVNKPNNDASKKWWQIWK